MVHRNLPRPGTLQYISLLISPEAPRIRKRVRREGCLNPLDWPDEVGGRLNEQKSSAAAELKGEWMVGIVGQP